MRFFAGLIIAAELKLLCSATDTSTSLCMRFSDGLDVGPARLKFHAVCVLCIWSAHQHYAICCITITYSTHTLPSAHQLHVCMAIIRAFAPCPECTSNQSIGHSDSHKAGCMPPHRTEGVHQICVCTNTFYSCTEPLLWHTCTPCFSGGPTMCPC